MPEYLFAVQTETGHEVVSATLDVQKVSDVTVEIHADKVVLVEGDQPVQAAPDPGGDLFLHRWPASDKLGAPVTHKVTR